MSTIDNRDFFPEKNVMEILLQEYCVCYFSITSYADGKIGGYSQKKSKLLKFLLDDGYVTRRQVEELVHQRLLSIGRATYDEHMLPSRTPIDNCFFSHVALGYALKHNHVPVENIRFEHGEHAEDYIKKADGLLESVIKQLLTYKDLNTSQSYSY